MAAEQSKKPVLIVSSERAAMAASQIVRDIYDVMMSNTRNWDLASGRPILLWPNADDRSRRIILKVADILAKICPEIKLIKTDDLPDGWCAADALADGMDWPAMRTWATQRVSIHQPTNTRDNSRDADPSGEEPPDWPEPPPDLMEPPPNLPEPPPYTTDDLPEVFHNAINWGDILSRSKNGPFNNLDNAVRVLENDPDLIGKLWYDEFLNSILTTWQGPERKWSDSDEILLQLYIQRHVGLTRLSMQTCHDAAMVVAFRNIKNGCKDYLNSLVWDETPRLDHLMSDAFGADFNAYTNAVGRCWIISMVARVLQPGCKVDTVPVLEGNQGVGKSTALSIIGGKWFVECHESVLTKDFYSILDGHMLVEISEMHSFSRSEVERVKGIISCQVDRYRKPYGRNAEDHPRQTVLVCTTNRDDWQRDDTGARRFWPILCGEINIEWLKNNRDQIFAEAIFLFKQKKSWWDVPLEDQKNEVEKRRDCDSWEHVIDEFLFGRTRVSITEILEDCLRLEVGKHDMVVQKRVGRVLRILGWKKKSHRSSGKVQKLWVTGVTGGTHEHCNPSLPQKNVNESE